MSESEPPQDAPRPNGNAEGPRRLLTAVGVEPIAIPTEEDSAWAEGASNHMFCLALGSEQTDDALRERIVRILAVNRVEEARAHILGTIAEHWGTEPWYADVDARLRMRWSQTVNVKVNDMLDVLSEIGDAVLYQDIVGLYVLAQTDRDTTRKWSSGQYDRSKLAFAFGLAQLELYHGALYGHGHDEEDP